MALPRTFVAALPAALLVGCGGSQITPPLHVDMDSIEAPQHNARELEPMEAEARTHVMEIEECFTSHSDMPLLENMAIPMQIIFDEEGDVEEVHTELPPDYQVVQDCIEAGMNGWGIHGLRADELRINWLVVRF